MSKDVRTISQDVESGPFRLTNLPILSGQGDASIVVRDSAGRDVETTLPFLVSNKLLRGGLLDFSVEAGFPRLFYGALSNDYQDTFAGSASLRFLRGLQLDCRGARDHIHRWLQPLPPGLLSPAENPDLGRDRLGPIVTQRDRRRCAGRHDLQKNGSDLQGRGRGAACGEPGGEQKDAEGARYFSGRRDRDLDVERSCRRRRFGIAPGERKERR
jgi:hypothetical protein